jgi:hypothetical protein
MKQILRPIGQWALAIHIYLSVAGFLLVLFFALTGLTLNHTDFALRTRTTQAKTIMLPEKLTSASSEEEITRELRAILGVKSPVTLYKEFPEEIEVVFAGPGSQTRVLIHPEDRMAEIDSETRGLLGRLEDLHKGHDSGRVWWWTIDITAILLAVSSITGVVTLTTLPARRRAGFIFGTIGLVILLVIYAAWVPT